MMHQTVPASWRTHSKWGPIIYDHAGQLVQTLVLGGLMLFCRYC